MSEVGKIRQMNLYEVDNGFVVQVGCKTLVFTGESEAERAAFADLLCTYVKNPNAVEQEWYKTHLEDVPDPMTATEAAAPFPTIGGGAMAGPSLIQRAGGLR